MSTPIFHEHIIQLKAYEKELYWFQRLFFPTSLKQQLDKYSVEKPDSTQAFHVYFTFVKPPSIFEAILSWIGTWALSGLRQFEEDIFTQTIADLPILTLETFNEQVIKEESVTSSIPRVSPISTPRSTPNEQNSSGTTITPEIRNLTKSLSQPIKKTSSSDYVWKPIASQNEHMSQLSNSSTASSPLAAEPIFSEIKPSVVDNQNGPKAVGIPVSTEPEIHPPLLQTASKPREGIQPIEEKIPSRKYCC